jgi:hypothetical protein
MQLIKNNPYRIVGLLVGATAREQERQVKRLKQFIDAEQEPQDDFSFPTLGSFLRTTDNVSDAASKLNLNSDKMNAALFWFYKGNSITDEPALDFLKESDAQNATDIWAKLTATGEVSQRNSSAFQNLSTLLLCNAFNGTSINSNLLEQGLSLKLKFLESDFIQEFKALATDATYKANKSELQLQFLNQVQAEIDKNSSIKSSQFLDIINKQSFSAKDDFMKGFVQKPIEQIEKQVDDAKTKRKANPANAVATGRNLYEQTYKNLADIKPILGAANIKFSSISDKVSDEILQCGVDYFTHYRDTDTDPSSGSMDLLRKAKAISVGNIIKQRCDENIENLQEWIDNKPERDKQQRIHTDFEKLKEYIDEYEGYSKTAANAKHFLGKTKPHLENIKGILGRTDELYLGVSSRVASDAQGMCVAEINRLQEAVTSTFDQVSRITGIFKLKMGVDAAWEVTSMIDKMDLRTDFRKHHAANSNSLYELKSQLDKVNMGQNSGSNNNSGGSSGCYIATMAYGDYEHPQVIVLREFRDSVLDKSMVGKWFIKTYYHYSPKLVEVLKNKKTVNSLIRQTLNQLIKIIK